MIKFISAYKKMSVPAKAAIWFIFCSLLQKGISTITVPIFTRIMSTEQYGTYSLYLSWLNIFTVFTSLNLYYGVFNNAMVKFENNRDRYISSMQGLTISLSVIFLIIFIIARDSFVNILDLSFPVLMLMIAEMFVTPAIHFWAGRQRFEFKYKILVGITLLKSLLNPLLGLAFVLCSDDKATARILAIVVVEVAVCGTIMLYQFIKGKVFFDKEYWKYALTIALPVIPHYLSGIILNQGDRIMIDKMVGTSEVAIYSVAYSIGMLVQIFTNSVNNSYTPWVYSKIKDKDYYGVKNVTNLMLILIAGIIVVLMLFSPEIIWIFGSEEYAEAIYVIPPVACSVFFIFMYNIFAIPEFYFEKTKFLMISSVIAAVLNVLLNCIFIPLFGYYAAGYTTLICYIIYSIGHYIISNKISKSYAVDMELFDKKFIVMISGIIIVTNIVVNFLFNFWYLRYGIALILGVCVFMKKNVIVQSLKMIKKK